MVKIYFALDGLSLKLLVSFKAAPAVRRASCDKVASLNAKHTDQPDGPRPASIAAVTQKVGCMNSSDFLYLQISVL